MGRMLLEETGYFQPSPRAVWTSIPCTGAANPGPCKRTGMPASRHGRADLVKAVQARRRLSGCRTACSPIRPHLNRRVSASPRRLCRQGRVTSPVLSHDLAPNHVAVAAHLAGFPRWPSLEGPGRPSAGPGKLIDAVPVGHGNTNGTAPGTGKRPRTPPAWLSSLRGAETRASVRSPSPRPVERHLRAENGGPRPCPAGFRGTAERRTRLLENRGGAVQRSVSASNVCLQHALGRAFRRWSGGQHESRRGLGQRHRGWPWTRTAPLREARRVESST